MIVSPALRRAIREATPARRGTIVRTAAEETGTDWVTVRGALDQLERDGEVYIVEDEVRETTREVA